ncbi:MAG: sulfite exporter TauE/SafE family protein [Dehalococcoidia bacterium]|nr:sulfite exporter TauE/SafE family protein [Dehalococcoidia bacterium]
MATQRTLGGQFSNRSLLYLLFAVLALLPLLVFGVAKVPSDAFGLQGPGGPLLAFSAGVLSFVSPCVLPLVPIYITHLSGASIENGRVTADRRLTFTHAVAFVAGLSLVFIVLGTSAGLLGSYFFKDNQRALEQVSGVMLLVMGVVLIPAYGRSSPLRAALLLLLLTAAYYFLADVADLRGDRTSLLLLAAVLVVAWLRFAGYLQIPFLARTFELDLARNRGVGYTRSALVGGAFALGWTPCIGPILGSILTLAATSSQAWTGTYLLVAYSLGFAVPFLITGLAMSDVTRFLRRIAPYTGYVEALSAVMLIALGLLLWHGRLTGLNGYFDFADFNSGL